MKKGQNIISFVHGVRIMNHRILKYIRFINNKLLEFSYKNQFTYVLGKPNGIMMEPYSGCNYNCPLCPSGLNILKRNKLKMTFEEFKRNLGNLKYTTEYITLFHFGEPLLNDELYKMIEYCNKYDISTQVSTNGMLLNEEKAEKFIKSKLNRIIFSIDTYNADIYSRYRVNGKFEVVVNNIKKMVEMKKRMNSNIVIVAQYMLMNDNEDIDKMKEHGKALGVDEVLIKTIGIGNSIENYEEAKKFLPEKEELNRYNKNTTIAKLNNYKCKYVWKRMVVCSDGICLPCCRDQKVDYILGECNEKNNLSKIWNSKKYRDFRKRTLKEIKSISMCDRCPEVLKYKLDPWVEKNEQKNCKEFKL